jgi:hypothetical protein
VTSAPDDDGPGSGDEASQPAADQVAAGDVITLAAELHDWSERTDPAVYAVHATQDGPLQTSALPVLSWIWKDATVAEGLRTLAGIVYANGLPYPYHRAQALACAYWGPATAGGAPTDARFVVAVGSTGCSHHVALGGPPEEDGTLEVTGDAQVLLERVTDALAVVYRVAGLP